MSKAPVPSSLWTRKAPAPAQMQQTDFVPLAQNFRRLLVFQFLSKTSSTFVDR